MAIDPLGIAAGYTNMFPYNAPMATPYLTRIFPSPQVANAALADSVFRAGDDLLFEDIGRVAGVSGRDLPPGQTMTVSNGGSLSIKPWKLITTETKLKRASEGNYSWLATIVTDPNVSALTSKSIVSVAVFYKRDLSVPGAGEMMCTTQYPNGIWTGEIQITFPNPFPNPPPTNLKKGIKPGQWIMLAGRQTVGPLTYDYYRWYRVGAADVPLPAAPNPPSTQLVTLQGADWNLPANVTRAWLFDGVIAVYEKNMQLEVE